MLDESLSVRPQADKLDRNFFEVGDEGLPQVRCDKEFSKSMRGRDRTGKLVTDLTNRCRQLSKKKKKKKKDVGNISRFLNIIVEHLRTDMRTS